MIMMVVNMQNSSDLETFKIKKLRMENGEIRGNQGNGENSPCCFGCIALSFLFFSIFVFVFAFLLFFGGLLSCAKKPLPSEKQWTKGLEDPKCCSCSCSCGEDRGTECSHWKLEDSQMQECDVRLAVE